MDILKFLGFLVLVPYPAGLLLTRWFKIPGIFRSLVLGLFVITLESYFLGLAGLYSWSIPVLLIQSAVLWIIGVFPSLRATNSRSPALLLSRSYLASAVIILLAVYINSLMLTPFGKITPQGISLYGAHFVDSTWHLAVINNLDRSLPPENPIYAGVPLTNYHYLVDLQISLIHRITGINTPDLYFRLFGPLYLLLLSWLIYDLGRSITGKQLGGLIAMTLFMLGSNLYYLAPLVFPGAAVSPSVAWVDFFSTKTVNYPLLVSLTLLVTFLDILRRQDKLSLGRMVVLGLFSGGLLIVKSHTALVWLGALAFTAILKLFKKTPNFSYLILFAVSLIVNFTLYIITVSSGNGALIFSPLWFIRVMYESPERLNNPVWELRRQTLLSIGAYLGVAKLYLQGLFWFLFINFGIFLPGVIAFFNKNITPVFRRILLGITLASLALTLLFIQRGAAWNSIQFIYVIFLPLSLLTAYIISRLPRSLAISLFVLLITLSLPGNKYISDQYQERTGSFNISPSQVELVNYLSALPPGPVLTDSTFLSGSYLQAYSGKSLYVGDLQMLESLSIDHSDRDRIVNMPFTCSNLPEQVKYLLLSRQNNNLSACSEIVETNNISTLYKVN
jgi:hypothetical protein